MMQIEEKVDEWLTFPSNRVRLTDTHVKYRHTGDLRILGDIPEGVHIEITNGSVVVEGDMKKGASLTAVTNPPVLIFSRTTRVSVCCFWWTTTSTNTNQNTHTIQIRGDLCRDAKIYSTAANIEVENLLLGAQIRAKDAKIICQTINPGATVETSNRPIFAENIYGKAITSNAKIEAHDVGDGAHVETTNAKITVCNVGKNATIISSNAKIKAHNIGNGSTVSNSNAKISVINVGKNVIITSSNGEIETNDVGRGSVITTSNAPIYVRGWVGGARLETRNADISVFSGDKHDPDNIFITSKHSRVLGPKRKNPVFPDP